MADATAAPIVEVTAAETVVAVRAAVVAEPADAGAVDAVAVADRAVAAAVVEAVDQAAAVAAAEAAAEVLQDGLRESAARCFCLTTESTEEREVSENKRSFAHALPASQARASLRMTASGSIASPGAFHFGRRS